MSTETLKQNVLVNLRSVIQSCKGGVPLVRLQNDYKLLIGAAIPFSNLGYDSLRSFLESIPQVIRLKTINGQTMAEAVADSTTVHLQSLISKQKSTKTKKCSVVRFPKKTATKPKSSSCPNCASSSRSALTNSGGAPSPASSSASLASDASSSIKDKQEIEALKAKLSEEQKTNAVLKSRVNQLLSESEPKLEDEHATIQRMKYQIGILRKQMLLRHAASPQTAQVNQSINEIAEKIDNLVISVEKLPHNSQLFKQVSYSDATKVSSSGVPNGNSLQIPKHDPIQIYQQQCKETEELKKQVQLQNTQILNLERKLQSQLQKLQNQIKNNSPSTPFKETSDSVEDLKNKEQVLLTQDVENIMLEFSKLKNKVETEYFVHLLRESEKLKDFDRKFNKQKARMENIEGRIQKVENKVDKVSIKNLADVIVKQLVSSNLINIPQVLSTSNNRERYIPPHRRLQQLTEQMPNLPTDSATTEQQSTEQILNLPIDSPTTPIFSGKKKKKKKLNLNNNLCNQ